MSSPTGSEGLRRAAVYRGGRKRGATKSPTVQVGPPNGNNTASSRTTPRHRTQPTEPPAGEQHQPTDGRTSTANENRNHDPRLRTTQPGHNTQDRPPARPAHPPRKELQHEDTHQQTSCTAQQRDDPNQDPQPTKQVGAGVKEGSKGNRPPHVTPPTHRPPGPTRRTRPPTRYPTPKPDPNQKPHPETRTPPTLLPPITHTPPGTLHTCHGPHPTDANACQQTGINSANKSSQKRTTNAQASTQPPHHHPLEKRRRGGRTGGTTPHAPCAQQTSTTSLPATTTN